MTRPLVSVVIPSFNRATLLREAMERLTLQTAGSLEIIVVDDGSTDGTGTLVRTHPGVRYFRQANQGPSAARNTGLAQASGDWVHFLDSDDLPDRDFLAALTPAFEDPGIVLAISDFRMVDASGKVIRESFFRHRGWPWGVGSRPFAMPLTELRGLLVRNSIVPPSGVLFRRSFLSRPWNPSIRVGEDRLYLLENLSQAEGRAWIHPSPLWSYRIHDSNAYTAHARQDLMAWRDNRCLKTLLKTIPDFGPDERLSLRRSIAANYFDWGYHCRESLRHRQADILFRASFTMYPSLKTFRAILANRFRPRK